LENHWQGGRLRALASAYLRFQAIAEAPPDRQLSKSPSKSRYQCYHFGMAQLLVRDLEEEVVQALRQRAAEEGTSVEEAHRRLLRSFLLHKKPSKTFKEALLEMPDDGDHSIFQRVERKPRKIVF
jgi:antitoxin FitA